MRNFLKYVRRVDIFSHPILLHFDEAGETHRTIFGGFASIIYCVFAIAYISFCIYKMVAHAQDMNVTAISF